MNREEYRAMFWKRAFENGAGFVADTYAYVDADRQTNRHMEWADDLSVPPWNVGPTTVSMLAYCERNSS